MSFRDILHFTMKRAITILSIILLFFSFTASADNCAFLLSKIIKSQQKQKLLDQFGELSILIKKLKASELEKTDELIKINNEHITSFKNYLEQRLDIYTEVITHEYSYNGKKLIYNRLQLIPYDSSANKELYGLKEFLGMNEVTFDNIFTEIHNIWGRSITDQKSIVLSPEGIIKRNGNRQTIIHEFTHAAYNKKMATGEGSIFLNSYYGNDLKPLFVEPSNHYSKYIRADEIHARLNASFWNLESLKSFSKTDIDDSLVVLDTVTHRLNQVHTHTSQIYQLSKQYIQVIQEERIHYDKILIKGFSLEDTWFNVNYRGQTLKTFLNNEKRLLLGDFLSKADELILFAKKNNLTETILDSNETLTYRLSRNDITAVANTLTDKENARQLTELYESTIEAQRVLYKKMLLEQVSLNLATLRGQSAVSELVKQAEALRAQISILNNLDLSSISSSQVMAIRNKASSLRGQIREAAISMREHYKGFWGNLN